MDVPELVVIYVNSSLLAKDYDSGPPSLQREGSREKGDPNRNPWLAKMM